MTRNRQNGETQIAGFAPTRLIISIFHHLIVQYFESAISFISASQATWRRKMIRRVGARSNLNFFIMSILSHLAFYEERLAL